jgi:hypothetical protein
MKTCKSCGESKEENEYFPHPTSKGGLYARCKICVSRQSYESRKRRMAMMLPERVEEIRKAKAESTKRWAQANPGKAVEAQRRYFAKNKDREAAHNKLKYAVRTGKVTPEPCWVCGEYDVQGHHPDYSVPLSVVWLCRPHHTQLHREAKVLCFNPCPECSTAPPL